MGVDGVPTKAEFEIFDKLVRDLLFVRIAAELRKCQLLVGGAWRFKPVEVYFISSCNNTLSDRLT